MHQSTMSVETIVLNKNTIQLELEYKNTIGNI